MDTDQLGADLGDHPTENDRRRRTAVWFLVLGLVAVGVGVPWSIRYFNPPPGQDSAPAGVGMLPGGLTGLGVLFLCFGLALLVAAARSRGAGITLYERGIVLHRDGTARAIRWPEIARVQRQGVERRGSGHELGVDFRCVLHLTDGRHVAFTSYTREATLPADRIEAALEGGTPT